jgi:hypothetical protein
MDGGWSLEEHLVTAVVYIMLGFTVSLVFVLEYNKMCFFSFMIFSLHKLCTYQENRTQIKNLLSFTEL